MCYQPHRHAKRIPDTEIVHFVSVALNDALRALADANAERTLESRAEEAQSGLHEKFRSLPSVQRTDPTVLAEYRKALVFEDLSRDLALKMVTAIRSYAALQRELPDHIA